MAYSTKYKFDALRETDVELKGKSKKEALEEAAVYLKEELLSYIGNMSSPVSGGRWIKSLSKEYAKKKAEESSVNGANLENTGNFLDSLEVDVVAGKLQVSFGEEYAGRLEAFNEGQYGSNSKDKPRQIFPKQGQTFKRDIILNIKKILEDFEE